MAGKLSNKKLSIAFLGGRILGFHALEVLNEYKDFVDVKIVIAHKIDGEEGSDWNPSILPLAKKFGFPIFRPKSLNDRDIIALFRNSDLDVILNPFCNRIIPKVILDIPRMGTINFHYGKLPEYKGRFIVSHMIINGEKRACVTTHFMEESIDSGDIIFEEYLPISEDDTAKDLYFKCTKQCIVIFRRVLEYLINGRSLPRTPQVGGGNYYPFEEPNGCMVDLSWGESKIKRFIRGVSFTPVSYPWVKIGNKKFVIKEKNEK